MKKDVRFSCPLDCFDACGLVATVVGDRVVDIRGDRRHPLTAGACCGKGRRLLQRLYHPQRLATPKRRHRDGWHDISWQQAVDEIADKLGRCISEHGSASILHYSGSGYGGLIKKIDTIFFDCLGGVTVPRGSLCWGAGTAAQTYDFGAVRGHHPRDIAGAQTILLWGRNPVDTHPHLTAPIRQARRNGAAVILIDPRRSASAVLADDHLAVRPATDGALALAMAHVIIHNGWHDTDFLKSRVVGFDAFRRAVQAFPPDRAAVLTGIAADRIERLARQYAFGKPATVIVGYGLQRYANGGNTVRCIDALGAVTGNIGVSGGGVNYANHAFGRFIAGPFRRNRALDRNRRTFSVARMGEFLSTENNPPIRCAFVSKVNPLVQMPDLGKTVAAFDGVDFKVVFDMFMTDTAAHADLVLPCTSVLEEEDVVFTSMFSPYINYSRQAVNPPPGVLSEFEVYRRLADAMAVPDFPRMQRRDFLQAAIGPLTEAYGIGLDELEQGPFALPDTGVPWRDGRFETPSGKYELYSERARADGLSALPAYLPPPEADSAYPLRLITPHWRKSMHSQQFAFIATPPVVYANPGTLQRCGLRPDDRVRVCTPQGALRATVNSDDGVADAMVFIHQGWWHRSGAVNVLTNDGLSDMGEQAAYYDCFCRLEPDAAGTEADPSVPRHP
jgi:anaerobic selenocysteine-containing dehydrogenase